MERLHRYELEIGIGKKPLLIGTQATGRCLRLSVGVLGLGRCWGQPEAGGLESSVGAMEGEVS